jgi:hypothetical protein
MGIIVVACCSVSTVCSVGLLASAYLAGGGRIGERGIDSHVVAVRLRVDTRAVCGRRSAFMRQCSHHLSPEDLVPGGLLERGVRRRRGGDHVGDQGEEDDTV